MKLETKYFGEIQIENPQIIHFPNPLLGFEEHKDYVLLNLAGEDTAEDADSLLCLQAINEPGIAFVLLNPFSIIGNYQPKMLQLDLNAIEAASTTALAFYVIAVLKENFEESTVNLKSPLVINPNNHKGIQIILDDSKYSFKHPIFSQKAATKEGE